MVQYRRNRIPGGTYFFTVTLRDRRSRILVEHVDILRAAFRKTHQKRLFLINAIVILPEHLHTIWTLPAGDHDYAGRWRSIKSLFTHSLAKKGVELASNTKGEYNLWQRRYWEHTIRDDRDYTQHIEYIHFNPVKHGLVNQAQEWPYSSLHRYVKAGLIPPDWAKNDDMTDTGKYGE